MRVAASKDVVPRGIDESEQGRPPRSIGQHRDPRCQRCRGDREHDLPGQLVPTPGGRGYQQPADGHQWMKRHGREHQQHRPRIAAPEQLFQSQQRQGHRRQSRGEECLVYVKDAMSRIGQVRHRQQHQCDVGDVSVGDQAPNHSHLSQQN